MALMYVKRSIECHHTCTISVMAGIGRLLFEAGYQNSSNKILSRLTHIMILFYLLEFKPEVYDLLLIDINVPKF
jgi:hypothetical protein